MKVLEEDGIVAYIKKRNIVKSYLKAKKYMENGFFELVDLRNNFRDKTLEGSTDRTIEK